MAQQCCYQRFTFAGKITEPRVAVFWAAFIMYHGRPKMKIDPYTDVYNNNNNIIIPEYMNIVMNQTSVTLSEGHQRAPSPEF